MGPASTLWKTAASGGGPRFFAGCIDGSNPAVVWLPSLERCPDQAHSHRYSVHLKDLDRLAGRLREQARSHRGLGASLRNWSAGRPPSRAGWLLQILSTSERFRSADRPPSRASSLPEVLSTSERFRSAERPPSRASSLPQKSKDRAAYTTLFTTHQAER
ncbi:hypothetical protein D3C71_1693300 [compost metagenome]